MNWHLKQSQNQLHQSSLLQVVVALVWETARAWTGHDAMQSPEAGLTLTEFLTGRTLSPFFLVVHMAMAGVAQDQGNTRCLEMKVMVILSQLQRQIRVPMPHLGFSVMLDCSHHLLQSV
jgi:hypothetical protein